MISLPCSLLLTLSTTTSKLDDINSRLKSIETNLENAQARLDSREKLGMKVSKPDPEIAKLLQHHADTSQELTLI